ncbi:hypothetical protein O181_007106 [Austropuccinia psidii MF-1]|uniref:Uncharacterized protein n=1 Tax=Austropuccinia psidii MF-1 TaxID=1389203 RepID=A0A9Q3BM58_9BASI|nr:hypothetical protein [Austropuccinia psidii MF-1]
MCYQTHAQTVAFQCFVQSELQLVNKCDCCRFTSIEHSVTKSRTNNSHGLDYLASCCRLFHSSQKSSSQSVDLLAKTSNPVLDDEVNDYSVDLLRLAAQSNQ